MLYDFKPPCAKQHDLDILSTDWFIERFECLDVQFVLTFVLDLSKPAVEWDDQVVQIWLRSIKFDQYARRFGEARSVPHPDTHTHGYSETDVVERVCVCVWWVHSKFSGRSGRFFMILRWSGVGFFSTASNYEFTVRPRKGICILVLSPTPIHWKG